MSFLRIGPAAFDNGYTGWRDPSILKATMAHEFGHSTIDRIMKGGRWSWKSGSGAGWNFGDGAIGYESEIRLAAKMHIIPFLELMTPIHFIKYEKEINPCNRLRLFIGRV
jgi:hypothetical protein